jgi:hypothetical protein
MIDTALPVCVGDVGRAAVRRDRHLMRMGSDGKHPQASAVPHLDERYAVLILIQDDESVRCRLFAPPGFRPHARGGITSPSRLASDNLLRHIDRKIEAALRGELERHILSSKCLADRLQRCLG